MFWAIFVKTLGMKKVSLSFIIGSSLFALASCQEFGPNDVYLKRMEDSVFQTFPTINRISIEVKEHREVYLTVGDKELYHATEEERIKVADQLAEMTWIIFKDNNRLSKGEVHFVEEETTRTIESEPKVYPLHLEAFQP